MIYDHKASVYLPGVVEVWFQMWGLPKCVLKSHFLLELFQRNGAMDGDGHRDRMEVSMTMVSILPVWKLDYS